MNYAEQTTANKFTALMELNHIISYAEANISRVQKIPNLENEEHADLVRGYAERVHEIMLDMIDLCNFGRKGGLE